MIPQLVFGPVFQSFLISNKSQALRPVRTFMIEVSTDLKVCVENKILKTKLLLLLKTKLLTL